MGVGFATQMVFIFIDKDGSGTFNAGDLSTTTAANDAPCGRGDGGTRGRGSWRKGGPLSKLRNGGVGGRG